MSEPDAAAVAELVERLKECARFAKFPVDLDAFNEAAAALTALSSRVQEADAELGKCAIKRGIAEHRARTAEKRIEELTAALTEIREFDFGVIGDIVERALTGGEG